METPINDFVKQYAESGTARLHMPGHKGKPFLGCEPLDLTEITGADSLYEASGIIAKSERNAASLFDSAATLYSTEGSSQCIRAMLYLALLHAPQTGKRPVIVAARNAHKTFVLAAALLDIDVEWLLPENEFFSLCHCFVSAKQLDKTLEGLPTPPAAVYVTSPDYLGGTLDIAALAKVCHDRKVPLLVDNAHGAYQHFLPIASHPLDFGADLCCDSAHKTLPVLTGGAYLQISKTASADFIENSRRAMALFGSTSPSYLILQSLDLANRYLFNGYRERLATCLEMVKHTKDVLETRGWRIADSDPLKLTIYTDTQDCNGLAVSEQLRRNGVEYEYADPDYVVLMATPENTHEDFLRIVSALGYPTASKLPRQPPLHLSVPKRCVSIRDAIFSKQDIIPIENAIGRIFATPTVSCPPAVSILVSGEVITQDAIDVFHYYHIQTVSVIK